MDRLADERFEKANKILDLYEMRNYTQEDIAKKLGISVGIVGQVTRLYNFRHTRKKSRHDPDNLREGETVNMCASDDNLDFLDKVTFKDTESGNHQVLGRGIEIEYERIHTI